FEKLPSVVLTSATLCTSNTTTKGGKTPCSTGFQPVPSGASTPECRQGAYLPHLRKPGAIYSITFRLADSMPSEVVQAWIADRQAIIANAHRANRELTESELHELRKLQHDRIEKYLDAGPGHCWLQRADITKLG